MTHKQLLCYLLKLKEREIGHIEDFRVDIKKKYFYHSYDQVTVGKLIFQIIT